MRVEPFTAYLKHAIRLAGSSIQRGHTQALREMIYVFPLKPAKTQPGEIIFFLTGTCQCLSAFGACT